MTHAPSGSCRGFAAHVLVVFAAVACLGNISRGQQRDLRHDLQGLHIRHTTAHYAMAGTISDAKLAQYGEALEFIHREYAKGFGELLAKKTSEKKEAAEDKFHVVVLAKETEYHEFVGAYFGASAESSSGLFVPSVNLLVILDRSDQADTHGTLFHEAFHQFAHRYVPAIPIWLNEGLATYYGTARPIRGGLRFDRPRLHYFALVRLAADSHKLVPLQELMLSSKAAFYDLSEVEGLNVNRRSLCYAQAYTLASYMINDKGGREHLRTYVRKLSEAKTEKDAQQVTRDLFNDKLLTAMVKPWMAYVSRG